MEKDLFSEFRDEPFNNEEVFRNHGIPFYKISDLGKYIEIRNDVWGFDNVLTEPKIDKDMLSKLFNDNNLISIKNESFVDFYQDFKMKEDILLTIDEQKLGFKNNYFMCILSPQKTNTTIIL